MTTLLTDRSRSLRAHWRAWRASGQLVEFVEDCGFYTALWTGFPVFPGPRDQRLGNAREPRLPSHLPRRSQTREAPVLGLSETPAERRRTQTSPRWVT